MRARAAFRCFPGEDFGFEALASTDPTVEAWATEHADFAHDQYLAFVYAYARLNQRSPLTATCSGISEKARLQFIRWC